MKNEKISPGAREKIPVWFSAAWSSRSVALALNMALVGYSSLYFTDVLGLNPMIIGTLLMISKFLDAFTDLVIGYIVDKTKTKWGKARPYEISIVFLWLFIYMMYATPEMGAIATYTWVFIAYTLQSAVFITILYGTDGVYLIRAVKSRENQIKVTANTGVYNMVFGTIVGMIIPQVIQNIGEDRGSWALVALCFAIPCASIGMLRFFLIPELDVGDDIKTKNEDRLTLKKGLNAMKGNKYLMMFAVMYFGYHFSSSMAGGGQTYYLKYVIGDLGVGTWMNAGMLVVLVLLIFASNIMKKFGTGNTLRAGLVLMMAGPIVRVVSGANIIGLIIGQILFVAGSVPIAFMLNVYLFECMDYGEWKTGTRIEGMMGSVTSFMAKVASALSGWAVGAIMEFTGYIGAEKVQTDTAIRGIEVCFNYAPILIEVVAFTISLKYDLEKKMPEVKEELANRHQ